MYRYLIFYYYEKKDCFGHGAREMLLAREINNLGDIAILNEKICQIKEENYTHIAITGYNLLRKEDA